MAGKLEKHAKLWELAEAAMREVDPEFWDAMTAVAFTRGFVGSPHIDTENLGGFYGLALGDFEDDGSGGGGGAIAVESGVFEVTHVDTWGRLAGGALEQTLCSS